MGLLEHFIHLPASYWHPVFIITDNSQYHCTLRLALSLRPLMGMPGYFPLSNFFTTSTFEFALPGFQRKSRTPPPLTNAQMLMMLLLHEHCFLGGLAQSIQAKLELWKRNQTAATRECWCIHPAVILTKEQNKSFFFSAYVGLPMTHCFCFERLWFVPHQCSASEETDVS